MYRTLTDRLPRAACLAPLALVALLAWATLPAPSVSAAPAAAPSVQHECEGTIAGVVTDADGNPLEGAIVAALPMTASGHPGPIRRSVAETETGEDGAYLLEGLCGHSYFVAGVYADPHHDAPLHGFYNADDDPDADPVTLEADDAAVTDIDLVLRVSDRPAPGHPGHPPDPGPGPDPRPGPPHPGPAPHDCQLDDGSITGVVTTEDGDPVGGAKVFLRPAPTTSGRHPGGTARVEPVETADDGTYRFEGLCEGHYQVHAALHTDAGVLVGTYNADGDDRPDVVTLSEDAPAAEHIDIQLSETAMRPIHPGHPGHPGRPGRPAPPPHPGPAPHHCDWQQGSIAGMVTKVGGEPVEDARVMAFPATGSGITAADLIPAVVTDEDGRYNLEHLCAGEYRIVAIDVSADSAGAGFYDPNGDGLPDAVSVGEDGPRHAHIDIVLSLGERPGGGGAGGGGGGGGGNPLPIPIVPVPRW